MAEAPNEDVVYGLLTLAGMEVALPLSALREVVPCPPDLVGLPVAAPGLLGALELRTLVLPVVDLRPAIGRPDDRDPEQVVVVVAHGGQVLGLLADNVRGVTQVPASALRAMTADGGDLLFSHTFRHPVTDGVVSVLDAAAVLRRPGVPTVADVTIGGSASGPAQAPGSPGAGTTQVDAGRGSTSRKLTLLRCGQYVLALDVAQVHTTLPGTDPRPSVLSSALCRGVTEFTGRDVPVVDPLMLLGFGLLPSDDTGAGVVLDFGHGYVVLALSALLDLTEVASKDILPLPPLALRRPELLAGIADIDDVGQCLVLDGTALLAEPQLVSLASLNTELEGQEVSETTALATGAVGEATVGAGRPYLTYSAGVEVATPLEQVVEILPFPATSTPTEVSDNILGVVIYRSIAMPVLCLATLLGRTAGAITAASCVLVVEVEGDRLAFAVEGLRAIDRLSWADPEPPEPAGGLSSVLESSPLVRIGEETPLLPDLDLRALARAVRGPVDDPRPVPALTG